jgi:hypothetical protein
VSEDVEDQTELKMKATETTNNLVSKGKEDIYYRIENSVL